MRASPSAESMFAQYFHDNLAGFSHALINQSPAHDGPAVAGSALVTARPLADLLDLFSADQGCHNRRATASQWSKYFFSRLIIPTLVAQLSQGRALDMRLAHWQGCFSADGLPVAFILDTKHPGAGDALDFSSLIDDALMPVVAALNAECRLAPRVFWSNAAMYFIWALGELEQQARVPAQRLSRARALVDLPQRADGGFNPFYRAYKALAPGALDGDNEPADRCRRLCCQRDLDTRWGLCANCPRAAQWPANTRQTRATRSLAGE